MCIGSTKYEGKLLLDTSHLHTLSNSKMFNKKALKTFPSIVKLKSQLYKHVM